MAFPLDRMRLMSEMVKRNKVKTSTIVILVLIALAFYIAIFAKYW